MRAVLEAAGVQNILTKSLGTKNPYNVVRATVEGLKNLRSEDEHRTHRGLEPRGSEQTESAEQPAPQASA